MNTKPHNLGQMINDLNIQGSVMVPEEWKHGDMCVLGGFTATMLNGIAKNHNSQHDPYGIAWRRILKRATEPLTTTLQTGVTAVSVPTGVKQKQPQLDPRVVPVRHRDEMQSDLDDSSGVA